MRKFFFLMIMILMIVPIMTFAQDAPEFNPALVESIMIGGLGLGVLGITEMLKRLLKKVIPNAGHIVGYAVSLVVAVLATWQTLAQTGKLSVASLILYSVAVFLVANGLYKFPKPNP